jgi:hypothetical protein
MATKCHLLIDGMAAICHHQKHYIIWGVALCIFLKGRQRGYSTCLITRRRPRRKRFGCGQTDFYCHSAGFVPSPHHPLQLFLLTQTLHQVVQQIS